MLSHVVNITVQYVNYNNSLDDSYCIEMQKTALLMYAIYPFQKYKCTHYSVWMLIERGQFKMLSYWGYGQSPNIWLHPSTRFSHCKAMIDMIGCWPWSFPGCSSVFMMFYLLCCPLSIYAFQLKVHEMHLWAISENWFIICWSIFSSLVKWRFTCTIHGKFTRSLIEMCRKYVWQFMTTRSTILHWMTYILELMTRCFEG